MSFAMMFKTLFSAMALFCLVTLIPPHAEATHRHANTLIQPENAPTVFDLTEPSPYFVNLDLVQKLRCGDWIGTAAAVGGTKYVTAHHVVEGVQASCTISGKATPVTFDSKALDYATLDGPATLDKMPIYCGGFHAGQVYYAVGYAEGTDFVIQRLIGTDTLTTARDEKSMQDFTLVRILKGYVAHGMSGGPIVDENGFVVGIVNAGSTDAPLTYSRELRATPLCRSSNK